MYDLLVFGGVQEFLASLCRFEVQHYQSIRYPVSERCEESRCRIVAHKLGTSADNIPTAIDFDNRLHLLAIPFVRFFVVNSDLENRVDATFSAFIGNSDSRRCN